MTNGLFGGCFGHFNMSHLLKRTVLKGAWRGGVVRMGSSKLSELGYLVNFAEEVGMLITSTSINMQCSFQYIFGTKQVVTNMNFNI